MANAWSFSNGNTGNLQGSRLLDSGEFRETLMPFADAAFFAHLRLPFGSRLWP